VPVESRCNIGIYLRSDRATVVCLASQGREGKLLDSFSIAVEGQGQQNQQVLADQISERCLQHGLKIVEATVALDCTLFMQHRLHSDFADVRKIAATVRFDAEEALATDISDLAVAFRVVSSDESGSTLDVFTVQRSVLSDILLSLQSNGIDPVSVEPDLWLLSRCLREGGDGAEDSVLFALLSDCRGYLVGLDDSQGVSVMRAFPVSPSQDRNELLTREILVSAALAESATSPKRVCVTDAAGRVDIRGLATKVGLPVDSCDLDAMLKMGDRQTEDGPNSVDFAIAYGALLTKGQAADSLNFRNDHMPFLGKKMRIQKAVRSLSIALTILFLALGVFTQTKLLKVNQDTQRLFDWFEPRYVAVMVDGNRLPKTMGEAVRNLESTLRRIRREKSGEYTGQESVPAKLSQVLNALIDCTAATDLRIDSITITSSGILINGNTSSRSNTDKVFAAVEAAKLEIGSHAYDERNNRDTFTMTVKPAKQTGEQ
jgi:hypothetical protein